ncbi:MAG: class I SAM-dependent methyltransferase [Myxococcaceae bacterium]
MSDPFFGELYLRSTRPFLSADVTAAEGEFLRGHFPEGPVLDLGCGHGRHLAQVGQAFGVDGDQLSLVEARRARPVARADLRVLPWRTGAFRGVYCWYNSLGTMEDDQIRRVLAEVARCTAPGGRLIVQGTHISRSRAQPQASFDGPIGHGDHLREWADFNFEKRRDELKRELTTSDGRVLTAEFFIRYFELDEWRSWLDAVGFELKWALGGVDGSPPDDGATDLIVGAERRAAAC